MQMQTIEDLMFVGMTYVLDAEKQLSQEANKMAEAAIDPHVKDIFQKSVTHGTKYAAGLPRSLLWFAQELRRGHWQGRCHRRSSAEPRRGEGGR